MFLSYLEEINKEKFLKVCVHAALANNIFAEEEKRTIGAYCREMDLPIHEPKVEESFEDLLKGLCVSTTKEEKKIIVLETLALMKSDGVYDEKEKTFMKKLIDSLGVSESDLSQLDKLLKKYIEIGKELYSAITE
jgi:tellurite resistance protein